MLSLVKLQGLNINSKDSPHPPFRGVLLKSTLQGWVLDGLQKYYSRVNGEQSAIHQDSTQTQSQSFSTFFTSRRDMGQGQKHA